MTGYILTEEQKAEILGVHFTPGIFFHPVQDINDDWFLFLSDDDKFALPEQYEYLLELPTVEFVPKQIVLPF